jgi:excisionase family DNA binding protein
MLTQPRQTVTPIEAAALAGVTRTTIYAWLKAGRIEALATPTGFLRIYADTLLKPYRADAATEQPDAAA